MKSSGDWADDILLWLVVVFVGMCVFTFAKELFL